jgi:flavodoxin
MKTIVIFDSIYGNTKAIAESITQGIAGDIKVLNVKDADISELKNLDLLIVGSPTHGGRPSKDIKAFLDSIPRNALKNIRIAAFDTGISPEGKGFLMRTIINIFNYAAKPISCSLAKKGGIVIAEPEGFIVEGREGPLKAGELERATRWAREISQKLEKTLLL